MTVETDSVQDSLNDEDLNELTNIIRKLSTTKQLILHRNADLLPEYILALWRKDYRRLNMRRLKQELSGEEVEQLLQAVQQHICHLVLYAAQLPDDLNNFERAGIKQLPKVQHCEIRQGSEAETVLNRGAGDGEEVPQWPLHALPKLLPNLRGLRVECPVQVRFIEQFSSLRNLSLYEDVECGPLRAIIESKAPLRRLHLAHTKSSSELRGIGGFVHLEDLVVPISDFNAIQQEVLSLPELKSLELRQTEFSSMVINEIASVIKQRSDDIAVIELNCQWLDNASLFQEVKLHRCRQLDAISLSDCKFDNVDFGALRPPRVFTSAEFRQCSDLQNKHLIDFMKRSTTLTHLTLANCPALSSQLLCDLYRIRRAEKKPNILKITLYGCPTILESYKNMFTTYWESKQDILIVEEEDNSQQRIIRNVRFLFYDNQPTTLEETSDSSIKPE